MNKGKCDDTLYSTFPEPSTSAARAGVLAPLPSQGEEVRLDSSWNKVSIRYYFKASFIQVRSLALSDYQRKVGVNSVFELSLSFVAKNPGCAWKCGKGPFKKKNRKTKILEEYRKS